MRATASGRSGETCSRSPRTGHRPVDRGQQAGSCPGAGRTAPSRTPAAPRRAGRGTATLGLDRPGNSPAVPLPESDEHVLPNCHAPSWSRRCAKNIAPPGENVTASSRLLRARGCRCEDHAHAPSCTRRTTRSRPDRRLPISERPTLAARDMVVAGQLGGPRRPLRGLSAADKQVFGVLHELADVVVGAAPPAPRATAHCVPSRRTPGCASLGRRPLQCWLSSRDGSTSTLPPTCSTAARAHRRHHHAAPMLGPATDWLRSPTSWSRL